MAVCITCCHGNGMLRPSLQAMAWFKLITLSSLKRQLQSRVDPCSTFTLAPQLILHMMPRTSLYFFPFALFDEGQPCTPLGHLAFHFYVLLLAPFFLLTVSLLRLQCFLCVCVCVCVCLRMCVCVSLFLFLSALSYGSVRAHTHTLYSLHFSLC